MSGQPDFKTAPRHKADIDEWKILRKLKLGPCRVCGASPDDWRSPPISLHHLIPRSLGGDDVPNGLVPLCGTGTTGCHGAVENRSPVACSLLRESLTLDELAYILVEKGERFLSIYYPRSSAEDVQAIRGAEASG